MLKRLSFHSYLLILTTLSLITGTRSSYAVPPEPDPNEPRNEVTENLRSRDYWLMPQVSVVMPTSFTLRNKDYEVAYAKQFPSLSQFQFGVVTPLKVKSDLQLLAIGRLGLSYKEGNYHFSKNTGEELSSKVKVFWLPISVGGKVQYAIPGFPYIKPSVSMGGGLHWLYQTGDRGGLNSSFWVPYYFITPALAFLEGGAPTDWFGGFTFGVTFQNSFSSAQSIRAWSFDLGINIML